MEQTTLTKVGFEAAIVINALSVIGWVFLSIFPGISYLSQGEVGVGFQWMFLNVWFYVFAITFGIALILNTYKDASKDDEEEETK